MQRERLLHLLLCIEAEILEKLKFSSAIDDLINHFAQKRQEKCLLYMYCLAKLISGKFVSLVRNFYLSIGPPQIYLIQGLSKVSYTIAPIYFDKFRIVYYVFYKTENRMYDRNYLV